MAQCVFCEIAAKRLAASFVLDEPEVLAFLDAHPLFHGHVLVVPRAHIVTLGDLNAESLAVYFAAVQRVARALPEALGCDGTFVANNNIVSQSVPHLHFHIVPRRRKDGLRGFFWPRVKYASDGERDEIAQKIVSALRPSLRR
jgi:histidine triad (HIT) family protein